MPSTSLVGEYDEVRRRVELLKQQHKEIVEARRAAEEVESIATLKFEEEKHALEEASRQKIRDLQRKLKESLDRSAKARDLHEREKRALLNKLDGVREALEEKRESDLAKKDEEIAAPKVALAALKELHALRLAAKEKDISRIGGDRGARPRKRRRRRPKECGRDGLGRQVDCRLREVQDGHGRGTSAGGGRNE